MQKEYEHHHFKRIRHNSQPEAFDYSALKACKVVIIFKTLKITFKAYIMFKALDPKTPKDMDIF